MNKANKKKSRQSKKSGREIAQKPTPVARVSMPAAYGVKTGGAGPRVNRSDRVVIRRREFVGTATNGSTTGFGLTALSVSTPGYDINPSSSDLFPWLSRIATCYERYRFNSLKFHFVPSSPTSTAGRFYAAVDYDYDDLVATTKQELMGNVNSVEMPVWQESTLVCHPASLARDLPYRYVSATGRTSNIDARFAYAGFLMCAYDTPTTNLLMDIWAEYEVEFVTPVYDPILIQDADSNDGNLNAVTAVASAVGTGFLGLPAPNKQFVTNDASPIQVVTPGALGVPQINVTWGGTTVMPSKFLDIGNAKGKGKLDLDVDLLVTGQTPATILNNQNLTGADWLSYDSKGNYLGSIASTPNTYPTTDFIYNIGSDTGEVSVASKNVKAVLSTTIEALLKATPSLKYIVPIIQCFNAAFGAGESGFGARYRRDF